MKEHSDPLNKSNKRSLYACTKIGCYNDDGVLIGNIRKLLLEKVNGKKQTRYLTGKYGWTKEKLALIDWSAFEEALQKQMSRRQTCLAQIMHDWQNVVTQKEKIDAMINNKCPTAECGMIEDNERYLKYQNKVMIRE